ncbi:hypothetical protein EDEG_01456 [Edhazardia aedis USNM 41457]|uniref:Rho-GAP domain-containing protein n=1 Tax=Edhazardia aedis (strain USNM 41457) TaxID=1003232 RepID=J9D9T9_EDHAE|nr:hypothetical protein EDEG_01456 [Edhazardia aedis USNM 41457]|eukprot:EJW04274.1 hypothetical protein EDEG_01456 [Edhazardia aedis USNM 41457]
MSECDGYEAQKFGVNDLDSKEFEEYRRFCFEKNKEYLNEYCCFSERVTIHYNQGFSCFFKPKNFTRENIQDYPTELKFSSTRILIPIEFDAIMTALLQKNIGQRGIFRVSQSKKDLDEIFIKTQHMINENCSRNEFLSEYLKHNEFLLAQTFTRMFSLYENTLFPHNLRSAAIKFDSIRFEDIKSRCYKTLFVSLPRRNRFLIESICFFLIKIVDQRVLCENSTEKKNEMKQIVTCIAPRIFLVKSEQIPSLEIFKLINILQYIITNIESIIAIDK